jgi:hypothetical protein
VHPAFGFYRWKLYLLGGNWRFFFKNSRRLFISLPWTDLTVHSIKLYSFYRYFQFKKVKFPTREKNFNPIKSIIKFYSLSNSYNSMYLFKSHYLIAKTMSASFNNCGRQILYKIPHKFRGNTNKSVYRFSMFYSYFSNFLSSMVLHLNLAPTSLWAIKFVRGGFIYNS